MEIDEKIARLLRNNKDEIVGLLLLMAIPDENGELISRVILDGSFEDIGTVLTEWLATTDPRVADVLIRMFVAAVVASGKFCQMQEADIPMVAGRPGRA